MMRYLGKRAANRELQPLMQQSRDMEPKNDGEKSMTIVHRIKKFIALHITITKCIKIVVAMFVVMFLGKVYHTMTHRGNQPEGTNPREPMVWRPKWFTIPFDQLDSHFAGYEVSAMKAMKALTDGEPFNRSSMTCNVENGLTHCCPGSSTASTPQTDPFGSTHQPSACYRGHYNKRLNVFENRPAQTTHDMFWNLPNNSNVVMIGDSVSLQIHDAFGCDVVRNNQPVFHESHSDQSTIDYHVNSHEESLTAIREWIPNWDNHSLHRFQERSPHTETLTATRAGKTNVVQIRHIMNAIPYLPMYRDVHSLCEWGNIYLLNWDLWFHKLLYAPGTPFDTSIAHGIFEILQECFEKHESLDRKPIFIWYEGTPQHFQGTVGGYWGDAYEDNVTLKQQFREKVAREEHNPNLLTNNTEWESFCSSKQRWNRGAECGPPYYLLDEERERHLYRQRMMDAIDQNPNLTFNLEFVYPDQLIQRTAEDTMYVIPMADVLNPRWDLHRPGDCTHWCLAPYLWELLWDSMARIIEKNH